MSVGAESFVDLAHRHEVFVVVINGSRVLLSLVERSGDIVGPDFIVELSSPIVGLGNAEGSQAPGLGSPSSPGPLCREFLAEVSVPCSPYGEYSL